MNRALAPLVFAAFVILVTSPHSIAQVRQPEAPLPDLSVWKKEIAALPMERKAIEAKREEFYALFANRDVPKAVYDEYGTSLQAAFNALRVAEGRAGILDGNSLLFSGLDIDSGADAKHLFLGEFSQVKVKRDSYGMAGFLGGYLIGYGKKCETRRPPQALEIMTMHCAVWHDSYNEFGGLIGSSCARAERVGTGVFGDPALVAADEKLGDFLAANLLSQLTHDLANPRSALATSGAAGDAYRAMERLVSNNDCASPGIRRFADNLLRFVEEKPPLTMK